ncbi:hypothetical protein Q4489_04565 [Thalassotalea sp. 1_MG-2023]|nr:hypothetical protein [Thalassotalea sp. 1_MG-2023]MDO6426271.1 hypothetical protein [Thalassotalea sp. 1_MG-2023]
MASTQVNSFINGRRYWLQFVGCKALLIREEQIFVAQETAQIFLARYEV